MGLFEVSRGNVDFSSLGELQQRLAQQFDHTFLVNADDPLLARILS